MTESVYQGRVKRLVTSRGTRWWGAFTCPACAVWNTIKRVFLFLYGEPRIGAFRMLQHVDAAIVYRLRGDKVGYTADVFGIFRLSLKG